MSRKRVLDNSDASRVRPMTFGRATGGVVTTPAFSGGSRGAAPAHGQGGAPARDASTQVAIHMDQEIERRARALAGQMEQEARTAGFDHGVERAKAEIGPLLSALSNAIGGLDQTSKSVLDDLAATAVQLGMAIAETVVGRAVENDPSVILDPVRKAIHALDGDDDVVAYLHPEDSALVREMHDFSLDRFRLAEDPSLARGECRVESAARIALDGINHRMSQLQDTLATELATVLDPTAASTPPSRIGEAA